MWRKTCLNAVVAAVVAWVLSVGAVGCLVTAFDLTMTDFSQTVLWIGMAAFLCAGCWSFRSGGMLIALLALLGTWGLYRQGEFWQQLWQLVYRITHIYNRAYHWGVFDLAGTPWDAGQADVPVLVLGVLLAAWGTKPICRETGSSLVICGSLLPLVACVVVTDTVPEAVYLYLLLLGIFLLMLPSHSRKEGQGLKMTLLTALPAALLLGGVFWAVPQEGYVNHAYTLREGLINWVVETAEERDSALEEVAIRVQGKEPEQVDLAAVGNRIESEIPVMSVTAEQGDVLYLRGQDYDVYTGFGWESSPHRVEDFSGTGPALGYVSIETRQEMEQLYIPYYPRGGLSQIGGKYDNTRMTTNYAFVRQGLPEKRLPFSVGELSEEYWRLPDPTRAGVRMILEPLLREPASQEETANKIAAFLQEWGRYQPMVDRMPETEEDFALWFLERGEGYCVHYATAAAVLLREAGIPARYVSGYMVPVRPGETVTVTGEHAHAWAEYYSAELGAWVILEGTPAAGLPAMGEVPGTEVTESEAVPEEIPVTQPPATEREETLPATEAAVTEMVPEEQIPLPEAPKEASTVSYWILGVLLLGFLAEGQRVVRLKLRKTWLQWGSPNQRCLKYWRQAEHLARRQGVMPPEDLHTLAQRAKFSQHTITEEQLGNFREYHRASLEILKKKPWYFQVLYRYLFALI